MMKHLEKNCVKIRSSKERASPFWIKLNLLFVDVLKSFWFFQWNSARLDFKTDARVLQRDFLEKPRFYEVGLLFNDNLMRENIFIINFNRTVVYGGRGCAKFSYFAV